MTGFIRPGRGADADLLRGEEQHPAQWNPKAGAPIDVQRRSLPIAPHRRGLLYQIENQRVVLVTGDPGSGKTTQLPQFLVDSGWPSVVCTQPRRLSAIQAARRVAQERGCSVGGEVGYRVRFDEACGADTRVLYVTDGVLLRELAGDPLLTKYSVVILDEAHVRTLHTDALLGLLRMVLRERPALRLVVASATLDIEVFESFFAEFAPASSHVGGSCYPVASYYLKEPAADYITAAVQCVLSIHKTRPAGDVLVFVASQEECDTLSIALQERVDVRRSGAAASLQFVCHALHAGVSPHDQLRALRPAGPGERKVIIATNIAETGLTVPGVVYVVDCGHARVRICDAKSGIERLVTAPVSQAEARQRAGRAGRVRSGMCFRLYTEDAFRQLQAHPLPEIVRTSLAHLVLQLKSVGVGNVVAFGFPTAPCAAAVQRAAEVLFSLGALDTEADVVQPLGAALAHLPASPQMSVFLLAGRSLGVGAECAKIAGMMSVEGLWLRGRTAPQRQEETRRRYFVAEGDPISLLNIATAFEDADCDDGWASEHGLSAKALNRAMTVRDQFMRSLGRHADDVDYDTEKLRAVEIADDQRQATADVITLACIAGWFANAAFRTSDGSYLTVRGRRTLFIHPQSALSENRPQWLLFADTLETDRAYARDCVALRNPMWLVQAAPHFYDYARDPHKRRQPRRAGAKRARAAADDEHSRRMRERQRRSNWLDIDPV
eukprot:TRINITY_DN7631_c0_g1_i1.p1 TRINITY_DN7631_c0_g1~~TRINITY_DN7631_c0_g1_i1.p1  ORF type:complete len:741 (+),score=195.30 TRINITY_DN7631_c0_g1_i1:59-2224(+)